MYSTKIIRKVTLLLSSACPLCSLESKQKFKESFPVNSKKYRKTCNMRTGTETVNPYISPF